MNLQKFIKNCLLKSQSHKGQVKIEKVITWKNRPHLWSYWTNPSEVLPGDKVVAGHQNLPEGHPLKTNKKAIHSGGVIMSPDKLPVLDRDLGRHKPAEVTTKVSMTHKTTREQQLFPDVFNQFTPSQIETFRTLGVVAGDENAYDFLSVWLTEYTTQLYTSTKEQGNYYSRHYSEMLYEETDEFQPPAAIDQAIEEAIIKPEGFSDLFNPWVVPISQIPQSIKDQWAESFTEKGGEYLKGWIMQQRVEFCAEKTKSLAFMKSCVDRLKYHPDYKDLAEEYSEILQKYVTARENKDTSLVRYKRQLLDDKFININTNLLFTKSACYYLVSRFDLKGHFMSTFPVLSNNDIEKLKNHDSNTFHNVVLRGIQVIKDDNSYYVQKYHDMLDMLDFYQRIKKGARPSTHLEDNEFKCKISTASAAECRQIEQLVKKNWDKKIHGHMTYKIHGIYKVEGLPGEADFQLIVQQNKQFKNKKSGGKNCQKDLFYHGTDFSHAKLIFGNSGGYKLAPTKVGTSLGQGLYAAGESSKSAQYIGECFSQGSVSGTLILNEGSLGDVHQLTTEEIDKGLYQKLPNPSLFAAKGTLCDLYPGSAVLLNNEWVFRDPKSIIPRFIIHMELI